MQVHYCFQFRSHCGCSNEYSCKLYKPALWTFLVNKQYIHNLGIKSSKFGYIEINVNHIRQLKICGDLKFPNSGFLTFCNIFMSGAVFSPYSRWLKIQGGHQTWHEQLHIDILLRRHLKEIKRGQEGVKVVQDVS